MFREASAIAVALSMVEATASSASSWHGSSARQDRSVLTVREMVVSGEVLQMCVETEAQSKPTLSDVGSKPVISPPQCHFHQGLCHMPRSSYLFQDQGFPRNQLSFLISVPLSANKTHMYNTGIFQTHSCMTRWGRCSGNCTTAEDTPVSVLHTESKCVHIVCNDLSKLKLCYLCNQLSLPSVP